MANIEFHDNSVEVKNAIKEACVAWLHEVGGEIKSKASRNSRVDSGQLKNSWQYKVDESKLEALVGSPLENAVWEEFGTGQYALKGDGRKGYWVFVKGSDKKSNNPKTYTLEGAKRAVAILRSKGLEAYYTNGKKPQRMLQKAFDSTKSKAQQALNNKLRG